MITESFLEIDTTRILKRVVYSAPPSPGFIKNVRTGRSHFDQLVPQANQEMDLDP